MASGGRTSTSPSIGHMKLDPDPQSINGSREYSSGYGSYTENNDPDPSFKVNVDKWKCPKCYRVLRNPVQTMCGHRYCETCLKHFLPEDGTPVKCPANEDDCEDLSSKENSYFMDVSARKEVLRLPVFCLYAAFGCLANLVWKDYAKHIETCPYKRVPCPNKDGGCNEYLKPEELNQHIKICIHKPVICSDCQQVGNSHAVGCPNRKTECTYEQFGCSFKGNVVELQKHHESFMAQHLEMVTVCIANMDLENTTLKNQLQETLAEKEIQAKKLNDLSIENKNLRERQKDLQRSLARYDDRLGKVEQQVSKMDTEFSGQKRELSMLQNSEMLRSGDSAVSNAGSLSQTVEQVERQMGVFNIRMVEMDLRFQLLEASSYDGTLVWKITNYARRKADAVAGRTLSLYSQPFYTSHHGYKMCGRVYLNGDGMGKGTHISLFFTVMKGDYDALLDWPFRQKVTFLVLDQETGRNHLVDSFRPDANSSSFKRPTSEMNIASGCPLFAQQSEIEGHNSRFIKDDTIFIKVIVDTTNIRHP